ncbi:MAG TPA: hypothetical protein VG052_00355 [Puia sp.]|jgi:phosphatidylethanolamine-binding protein (PEBP) family uncharacterized protein|nr:hypothetical protein [Puia sp.]
MVAADALGGSASSPALTVSSPALHLGEFPSQTKSLAIIVHDPDAARPGGFTHWVAFNIDPAQDIPEGFKGHGWGGGV